MSHDVPLTIQRALDRALRDLESLLPPGIQLPSDPEAPLAGAVGGPLDSLGVVNLMVCVEGAVAEEVGVSISLAEALGEPPETSPFRTRAALEHQVEILLRAQGVEAQ